MLVLCATLIAIAAWVLAPSMMAHNSSFAFPAVTASASLASPSEADALLLANSASFANAPRTSEFVINDRGQRLHVRSRWPGEGDPLGVVLSLHGYGAHSNRPTHVFLANELTAANYAYITLDFHSHGYSEGSPRGLIYEPSHLVDDALSVILALYADNGRKNASAVVRSAARMPLYLMGHSMGGGVALLVANLLTHGGAASSFALSEAFQSNRRVLESSVIPYFRGAFLVCPVVSLSASCIVRALVLNPLAAALPLGAIPPWIFDENVMNSQVWASPNYRSYIQSDGFPANNAGLSYGGNIRFQMLATILRLSDAVLASLSQATFPFVVIHDEAKDIVLPVESSKRLVAEAPSERKAFILIPNGLHDVIANQPKAVGSALLSWLGDLDARRGSAT